MHDFAYVSFVNNNNNYINLMKTTIESVIHFSKHKFIIYCVDIPEKVFEDNDQIIIRNITDKLSNIYYYKPFVIADAIKKGLKSGYYIEADDVLTPFADEYLHNHSLSLKNIPISPIHPDDVDIPTKDMIFAGITKKTQHYIHGHVLFNSDCLLFIEEWLHICTTSSNHSFRNADETVLNLLYWKYNCKQHYLEIIDPWYEFFYSDYPKNKMVSFHGCKDPNTQKKLFEDMKKYFSE